MTLHNLILELTAYLTNNPERADHQVQVEGSEWDHIVENVGPCLYKTNTVTLYTDARG